MLVLLCSMVVTCALAGYVICPRCASENGESSRFCSHCGVKIADGTNAVVAGESEIAERPVEGADNTQYVIDAAVVEAELKTATGHLKKGDSWLSFFYCNNAMALNMLSSPDEKRSERVLQLHDLSGRQARTAGRTCPKCGGTGKISRKASSSSLGGGTKTYTLPSTVCGECRGRRIIPGRVTLEQLRYDYGTAMQRYGVLRQGKRWSPVGEAWVPEGVAETLSDRETSTIKRVTGTRCPSCLGFGRTTCETCMGIGRMDCEKCEDGTIIKELEDHIHESTKRELRAKCDTCHGTQKVRCTGCSGRKNILCYACSGDGKRPRCTKCDGAGLKSCRKCHGTGTYKEEPCKTCRACGAILCTTCHGDGRTDPKKSKRR